MRLTIPQFAMLVGLVSLTFFFGGLILAFGLTIGQQTSWHRFTTPKILWLGSAVLVLSSFSLEAARYAIRRALIVTYRNRLALTLIFGITFLSVQAISAADLLRQGVAAAGNPHGSVFYAFMGIHGAHIGVGMAWLTQLWIRSGRLFEATEQDLRRNRAALATAAIFWHFMGVLWLVLFLLLLHWST